MKTPQGGRQEGAKGGKNGARLEENVGPRGTRKGNEARVTMSKNHRKVLQKSPLGGWQGDENGRQSDSKRAIGR